MAKTRVWDPPPGLDMGIDVMATRREVEAEVTLGPN